MWLKGLIENHWTKKCYNCLSGFKILIKTDLFNSNNFGEYLNHRYCFDCGKEWELQPWEY